MTAIETVKRISLTVEESDYWNLTPLTYKLYKSVQGGFATLKSALPGRSQHEFHEWMVSMKEKHWNMVDSKSKKN